MTFLKQKSQINFEAGELLTENNKLAPSIHCFYYSCIQLVRFTIRKTENISYNEVDSRVKEAWGVESRDSHMQVIQYISTKLEREYDRAFVQRFKNQLLDLKTLRTKSDYKNVEIVTSQCETARGIANDLRDVLNEFLKL